MEERKVGEYIKTKNGFIVKIIGKYEEIDYYILEKDIINSYGSIINCVDKFEIVKHSFNIIDLIEVGDYVNGSRVEQTYLDGSRKYIKLENRDKTKVFENRIYSEDIKSIVTKEMMESVEYKVGG